MNKSEFINFMADTNHCTKAEAERCINMFVDSVTAAAASGQAVNLVGFGAFSVQRREARQGRNPKTGESMHIAAYNQPMFKAGKKLKDSCN